MFKDWIKQESRRRGLSQRALAREMGISQGYVSDVLNDKRPPSVEFCRKLAETFGETPEHVLRLAGILPSSPPDSDPALEELLAAARSLSPEQVQEVIRFARFLRK